MYAFVCWLVFVSDGVVTCAVAAETIEEEAPPAEAPVGPDGVPGPPALVRQRSYKVMGKWQISQQQKVRHLACVVIETKMNGVCVQDMLEDVSAVLGMGLGHATMLLRHYKWNQEKLLKDYTTNPLKVAKMFRFLKSHLCYAVLLFAVLFAVPRVRGHQNRRHSRGPRGSSSFL